MKKLYRIALALAACAAILLAAACTPAESLDFDYDPVCTVNAANNTVTFNYTLRNSGYTDLSNCLVEFTLFDLYDGLNEVSASVVPGTTAPVAIATGGSYSSAYTFYLAAPATGYSSTCFVAVTRAAWDKDSDGIFNESL